MLSVPGVAMPEAVPSGTQAHPPGGFDPVRLNIVNSRTHLSDRHIYGTYAKYPPVLEAYPFGLAYFFLASQAHPREN